MREIEGFNGNYLIDEQGNIFSKFSNKFLKQRENKRGYKIVDLYIKGERQQLLVHRLVAQTFLNNQNNYPCVNHKDEDIKNNNVENLEWCSFKYNLDYSKVGIKAGIANSIPVVQLDKNMNILKKFNSAMEAQRETGISNSNINECCKNKRKTAGGFLWQYAQ